MEERGRGDGADSGRSGRARESGGTEPEGAFWEDAERVEQFARKDPDHRLVALIEGYPDPAAVRVLDLGCAGGRNTELLVREGFDVHAVDASAAMVERTRARVAPLLGDGASGEAAARERVRRGRMDDLSSYGSGMFDLVVALGVHHSAASRAEWERAADETARVLRAGGLLLFNQFTPAVDLTGRGVTPVAGEAGEAGEAGADGEPWVYEGFPAGRAVLLDADRLDAAWAERGLVPEVASETVRVELDEGRRVSVNALYRKRG